MEELIRIRNLTTDESNKGGLNNFRLQVFSGELFGLVGLNGSGKSSLADVLTGDRELKRGDIFLRGEHLRLEGQRGARLFFEKQGIFTIRNENSLIGSLSVSENMSISLKHRMSDLLKNPGRKGRLLELTLRELLPRINPQSYALDLPPAVHWEIGILKAYIEGARLIVLDRIVEFCSNNERRELFRLIENLKRKGTGFVVSFNKTASFLKDFDRIGIVRDGGLSAILHPSDYDAKTAANLMLGREYRGGKTIKKENTSLGRALLELRDPPSPGSADAVGLRLHGSEILGIYDPVQDRSGELINALSGNGGSLRVVVEGRTVEISEEHHALQAGIGIVSEIIFDKLFFRDLTAGENLAISAAKRSALPGGHIPSAADRYIRNSYLNQIGLPADMGSVPVKFIEKDYQFLLAIHMRILSGARIFILENPVRRADLLTHNLIYQRIESLRKAGTGVIFISTDYAELDGFCDSIIQYDQIGAR
jgi:ribose transport system ATP-binding protein